MVEFRELIYTNRAALLSFVLLFIFYYLKNNSGNNWWKWKTFKDENPRGKMVLILVCSMFVEIAHCIVASIYKYNEGYIINQNGILAMKPISLYSSENIDLHTAATFLFGISWEWKLSGLFFMHRFFDYKIGKLVPDFEFYGKIQKRVVKGMSIMRFLWYSGVQVIMLLTGAFSNATIIPQFVSNVDNLLIIYFSVVAIHKFKKLLRENLIDTREISDIKWYIVKNRILIFCLSVDIISLFALNLDSLTLQLIYKDLRVFDALASIFNIGFSSVYLMSILLVHPWKSRYHSTSRISPVPEEKTDNPAEKLTDAAAIV